MIIGTEIVEGSDVMICKPDGSAFGAFVAWGKCVHKEGDNVIVQAAGVETHKNYKVVGVLREVSDGV